MKEIFLKNGAVYVKLSYTPKRQTLVNKFGNLPIKYSRARLQDEREFRLLEKATRLFTFNITDEDEALAIANSSNQQKRPAISEKPLIIEIDDNANDNMIREKDSVKRTAEVLDDEGTTLASEVKKGRRYVEEGEPGPSKTFEFEDEDDDIFSQAF